VVPSGLKLDNAFWDFALEIYPSVAQPMLSIQSKGGRVNLILAALWAASEQIEWPDSVPDAIEQWHQQILPIRSHRMSLKPQLEDYPELEPLYKHLKGVELNMERVEIAMLHHWLAPKSKANHLVTAQYNLDRVLTGIIGIDQERGAILQLLKP
jgi:uncharacterized protein (TIGR02444 family)